MASSQKVTTKYCCNPVRKDGVIKEQVALEDLTKRNYDAKWGYVKDFNKICLDIAREKGISEEEYKRRITRRKGCKVPAVSTWELALSGPAPPTTTGEVGWRSSRTECSLERLGPLYISPRHTIDPPGVQSDASIKNIILG